MDNCIKCDSGTVCTSCQEGFNLNNNHLCSKIDTNNNNDKKNDGLSTGAILGIVFGCVGFLLIVAGVIYLLVTKVFKKNKNVIPHSKNDKVEIENEGQDVALENKEKVPEQNEPISKTTKRGIHNA